MDGWLVAESVVGLFVAASVLGWLVAAFVLGAFVPAGVGWDVASVAGFVLDSSGFDVVDATSGSVLTCRVVTLSPSVGAFMTGVVDTSSGLGVVDASSA